MINSGCNKTGPTSRTMRLTIIRFLVAVLIFNQISVAVFGKASSVGGRSLRTKKHNRKSSKHLNAVEWKPLPQECAMPEAQDPLGRR